MKAYLRAFDLWDVIESKRDVTPLPNNLTINQIKYHSKAVAKRCKTLSCIHSVVDEITFTQNYGF